MRTNSMTVICGALIAVAIGTSSVWANRQEEVPQTPLTEIGKKLETQYADQLERLRTELTAKIPRNDQAKGDTLKKFLVSDMLDARFAKYVVLLEATFQGLAEFAQQGKEQEALVVKLFADTDLMQQMLVADGANAQREGHGYGPAQYGQADDPASSFVVVAGFHKSARFA